MEINFKNKQFTAESLVASVISIWKKTHSILLAIFFVVFILLGWRIWQQSLSGLGWTQEKKEQFMDTQNKKVEFKEKQFNEIVVKNEERKSKNIEEYGPQEDIFSSY